jgi:hypothetical protein
MTSAVLPGVVAFDPAFTITPLLSAITYRAFTTASSAGCYQQWVAYLAAGLSIWVFPPTQFVQAIGQCLSRTKLWILPGDKTAAEQYECRTKERKESEQQTQSLHKRRLTRGPCSRAQARSRIRPSP